MCLKDSEKGMRTASNSPITVHYYLRDKDSENKTPVVMFVRYAKNTVKHSIGLAVIPIKEWNAAKERVIKSYPASHEVNLGLKNKQTEVIRLFTKFQNEESRNPTAYEMKELLRQSPIISKVDSSEAEVDKRKHLFGFIEWYLKECEQDLAAKKGTAITRGTIVSYKQAFRSLKEFKEKYYKNRPFDYEHIDAAFYTNFKKFLTSQYASNTVGKRLKVIKMFLLSAQSFGYLHNFNSREFRGVTERTQAVALTNDEVNNLFEIDLSSNPRLERVRDLFIVGVRTGLRFSDYSNIKPEHINLAADEISICQKKTQEVVTIPIHRQVHAILAKYDGKTANSLPVGMSNQKMNEYLKELGEVAGFTEPFETKRTIGGRTQVSTQPKYQLLTTHTARRTFATIEYLEKMPIDVIREITGHKSERSFLEYIKIPRKEKTDIMRNAWKEREDAKKKETKVLPLNEAI